MQIDKKHADDVRSESPKRCLIKNNHPHARKIYFNDRDHYDHGHNK